MKTKRKHKWICLRGNTLTRREAQCESQCEDTSRRALYEQFDSQCEPQCEDTRRGDPQCESQCETSSHIYCPQKQNKKSSHVDQSDFKYSVTDEKYLRNTPTFTRRAGLTARQGSWEKGRSSLVFALSQSQYPESPCLQRHQNDDPHCAASQTVYSKKGFKTRRGHKNRDAQLRRFEIWNTSRKENRRAWRKLKSSSSEAVRKVIAASPLGVAIQEASLLYRNTGKHVRASTLDEFGLESTTKHESSSGKNHVKTKHLLKICRQKHAHYLEFWGIQDARRAQRRQERTTRMRINSRRALHRNKPMQKKSGAPQEKNSSLSL